MIFSFSVREVHCPLLYSVTLLNLYCLSYSTYKYYSQGPKYPIILKELVVNCWAQEYASRPTAQEIVSILQSPDCLKLTNTYNTELSYSVVSATLVVTVDDQQLLWVAHTTDNKYKVTMYGFSDPECSSDLCTVCGSFYYVKCV